MTKVVRHRSPKQCIGEIHPDAYYTTDRVMETIGIGAVSLSEGVQAGVITKLPAGYRVYVRGRDVIAWIEKLAADRKKQGQ